MPQAEPSSNPSPAPYHGPEENSQTFSHFNYSAEKAKKTCTGAHAVLDLLEKQFIPPSANVGTPKQRDRHWNGDKNWSVWCDGKAAITLILSLKPLGKYDRDWEKNTNCIS